MEEKYIFHLQIQRDEKFKPSSPWHRKLKSRSPGDDHVYTYQQHKASIQAAASNGCQICARLCNYFERSEDHIPTELFDLSYRLSCPFEGDKAVCYLMLFYSQLETSIATFRLLSIGRKVILILRLTLNTTGLIVSQMLYLFFRTITSP
jgi:hypothetical protein